MIEKIKAIIVDDEANNRAYIKSLIDSYHPEVEVVAMCESAAEGRQAVLNHAVDLLFLDIEMPGGNGFTLLEGLNSIHFELIFITAYDNYAIRAIKFSALDYILKPVNTDEFNQAVEKAIERIENRKGTPDIQRLINNLNKKDANRRLALALSDKIEFVEVADIIRCEADGSYTVFYLRNKQKLLVSKLLKEYDELLTPLGFIRTHNSHLVNPDEIKSYIKTDGGYLLMKDGSTVSISRQRKDYVMRLLQRS